MRTALIVLLLGAACAQPKPSGAPKRVAVSRTGGTTFELVPAEGQHPYCLVYTVNKSGLTRLLTMSRKNESFECPPGRPVGGHQYRIPLSEGPVKLYTLFTNQVVNAASVSQQLIEQKNRQQLSVMDMRLPGAATLEVLELTPEADVVATIGEELAQGTTEALDGGAPADPSDDGGLR
jgi:hypothetical protein